MLNTAVLGHNTVNVNGYTIVTHVIPSSTEPGQIITVGPLQRFLKRKPKALGTTQIIIGGLILLLGIVLACYTQRINFYSGISFWGPLMYIITGSLAVAASNKLRHSVVVGALVMNVFSSITAAIAIIMYSLDLTIFSWHRFYSGNISTVILGVLLFCSIIQFIISICVSSFACKASCNTGPSVNITVIANQDGYCSVVSPPSDHNSQQYPLYEINSATMDSPPMESPPAYSEIKGQSDY